MELMVSVQFLSWEKEYVSHVAFIVGDQTRDSITPSPEYFELEKHGDTEENQAKLSTEGGGTEQISAADYDPSLDRREDELKRFQDEPIKVDDEQFEEVEEVEEEEVIEDMFSLEPVLKKVKKTKRVAVSRSSLDFVPMLISLARRNRRLPWSQLRLTPLRIRRDTIQLSSVNCSMEVNTKFSPPLAKGCLPTLSVHACCKEIRAILAKRWPSRSFGVRSPCQSSLFLFFLATLMSLLSKQGKSGPKRGSNIEPFEAGGPR